jgi:DNA polymerase-1
MVMMSADYSQIELRVMAHISGDPGLQEAFKAGEDIHTSTAARVFGIPAAEVTKDMRRKAKEVNFGIMYGIGAFGLAARLEIPQSDAKDIIARYFGRFPGVNEYIAKTIAQARQDGFVSTLSGRRRYIADINNKNANIRGNAERQAINMPIQGTAADMIKLAMIDIHRIFEQRGLRSRMLLQVHDELVFEVDKKEVEDVREAVLHSMKHAFPLSVPLEVEVGIGNNWLEAH